MYYNYFRDYDPALGRYTEADPIGLAGEVNHLFVYGKDNPSGYVDQYGLKWLYICKRRLYNNKQGVIRGILVEGYPFVGHCYVKFDNNAVGFYPNIYNQYWTVENEIERTFIIHRYCYPSWVSNCVYNCVKSGMTVGNTGSSIDNSGISNNCCTNLKNVINKCKQKCECEERAENWIRGVNGDVCGTEY